MTADVPYEELALAIARYVHAHLYREEERTGDQGPIRTVDTMCSSSLQIPAGVLHKLALLRPLDDFHRRWAFTVGPRGFAEAIRHNRSRGCSQDALVLAAIRLAERKLGCEALLECLARLGLCKPVDYRTRISEVPEVFARSMPKALHAITLPDFEIEWTERRAHYDALARDWPILIA